MNGTHLTDFNPTTLFLFLNNSEVEKGLNQLKEWGTEFPLNSLQLLDTLIQKADDPSTFLNSYLDLSTKCANDPVYQKACLLRYEIMWSLLNSDLHQVSDSRLIESFLGLLTDLCTHKKYEEAFKFICLLHEQNFLQDCILIKDEQQVQQDLIVVIENVLQFLLRDNKEEFFALIEITHNLKISSEKIQHLENLYSLWSFLEKEKFGEANACLKKILAGSFPKELEEELIRLIDQFYEKRPNALHDCLRPNKATKNSCFQSICSGYILGQLTSTNAYSNLKNALELFEMTKSSDIEIVKTIIQVSVAPKPKKIKEKDHQELQKKAVDTLDTELIRPLFPNLGDRNVYLLFSLAISCQRHALLAYLLTHCSNTFNQYLKNTYSKSYRDKLETFLRDSFRLLSSWEADAQLLEALTGLLENLKDPGNEKKYIEQFGVPYIKLCIRTKQILFYTKCLHLLGDLVVLKYRDRDTLHTVEKQLLKGILSLDQTQLESQTVEELATTLDPVSHVLVTKWLFLPRIDFILVIRTLMHVYELCKQKSIQKENLLLKSGYYLLEELERSLSLKHAHTKLIRKILKLLLNSNDIKFLQLSQNCLAHSKIKNLLIDSDFIILNRLSLIKRFDLLSIAFPHDHDDVQNRYTQTFTDFLAVFKGVLLKAKFHDKYVEELWEKAMICATIFSAVDPDSGYFETLTNHFLKLKISKMQKRELIADYDRQAIQEAKFDRSAPYRRILQLDQHMRMSGLEDEMQEHLKSNKDDEVECEIAHRYFSNACESYVFSISPNDVPLGNIHASNALDYVEKAWKDQLVKDNTSYTLCTTYLSNPDPDTPISGEIVNKLCKKYSLTDDPIISTYLLYLLTLAKPHLTLQNVLPLLQGVVVSSEPIEFAAIAQFIIGLNTQDFNPGTIDNLDKIYLHELAECFANKLYSLKESFPLQCIWGALIKTYIKWGLYNDSYEEFFKLMTLAARTCLQNINPSSLPGIFPSILVYTLIKSKHLQHNGKKAYRAKREEFLEQWVELQKKEGIAETLLLSLIKRFNSPPIRTLMRQFNFSLDRETIAMSLKTNLTFIKRWAKYDLVSQLRNYKKENKILFQ